MTSNISSTCSRVLTSVDKGWDEFNASLSKALNLIARNKLSCKQAQDLLQRHRVKHTTSSASVFLRSYESDIWTHHIQLGQHCRQWHVLHVSGKAFVEPQVIPPAHSYQVSKPLWHNIRNNLAPASYSAFHSQNKSKAKKTTWWASSCATM